LRSTINKSWQPQLHSQPRKDPKPNRRVLISTYLFGRPWPWSLATKVSLGCVPFAWLCICFSVIRRYLCLCKDSSVSCQCFCHFSQDTRRRAPAVLLSRLWFMYTFPARRHEKWKSVPKLTVIHVKHVALTNTLAHV